MEPQKLDEEELTMGIENISEKGAKPISRLSPYIPPRKSTAKVMKDPNHIIEDKMLWALFESELHMVIN